MPAPEKLTIETPEQIPLEFPLASAGSRFLALSIDTLIQLVVFVLLAALMFLMRLVGILLEAPSAAWFAAAVVIGAFLLYYGYFAAFEALWNGQTPGKRLMRLRVLTTAGRPIGPYEALLRNLVRIVDALPGIYAVALIAVFFTRLSQRLGDVAAGTVVVHEPLVERHEAVAPPAAASRVGGSRLTPQELAVVEAFLSRRHDLPYAKRASTASAIAARVRRSLDIPEPSVDDETLLEQAAAEARDGWR